MRESLDQLSHEEIAILHYYLMSDQWFLRMRHAPTFGVILAGIGQELDRLIPWAWIGCVPSAPPCKVSFLFPLSCSLMSA